MLAKFFLFYMFYKLFKLDNWYISGKLFELIYKWLVKFCLICVSAVVFAVKWVPKVPIRISKI